MQDAPVGRHAGDGVTGEPPSAFYTLTSLPVAALGCVVPAARGRMSRRAAGRCDELSLPEAGSAAEVLGPDLLRAVTDAVSVANGRWWRLDVDSYRFKVLRYGPGHYAPAHMDMFPGSMCRKVTAVVQLTDPSGYVGGDLEVIGMGERWSTIPRQVGLAAVFPSWTRHRVTRVEGGERWSLAVWGYGPPAR